MRSKRELMREMLENAVIESAKPNYKFSYNCSTETNYKWVRIEDSWFSCVRRLKDKDNFCTKEDRYPLFATDKVHFLGRRIRRVGIDQFNWKRAD